MSDRFVNPYNFIPLKGNKAKAYSKDASEKKYTGAIIYSLTTKTPLIIPATDNSNTFSRNSKGDKLDEVDNHKSYDFYSYTDSKEGEKKDNQYNEPVIPGSEIRGMIRSIYETLTDSCMSILNDDQTIAKRTGEVFSPGLIKIEEGKALLYKAKNAIYRPSDDFNEKFYAIEERVEGEKVFFNLKASKRIATIKGKTMPITPLITKFESKSDNMTEGYLMKGVAGPKMDDKSKEKHNCHVFYLTGGANVIAEFGEKEKNRLYEVIQSYQNQDGHSSDYEEYENNFKEFYNAKEEGTCFPIYYSEVGNESEKIIYYSPASITKEIAKNKVKDRAKAWVPCKESDRLCPACDLFGMVGKKGEAKASSIRFSDSYLQSENADYKALYEGVTTLQTLNSPKISNSEFYLKKPTPTATFWTYDYYIDGGKIHFYKDNDVIIRGRKFYWHQPEMRIQNFPPDKMNVTVRPLKSGVDFWGKVYFEQITKKQLDQIIFILNGGKEGKYDYKMGMGKPLGYGSVHTSVKKVEVRNIVPGENGLDYMIDSYNGIDTYEGNGFSHSIKEAFEIMMSFNSIKGKDVTYPIIKEQNAGEEGFKWFTEQNHLIINKFTGAHETGMSQKRINQVLEKALPEVKQGEELSLPKTLVIDKPSKPSHPKKNNNGGYSNQFNGSKGYKHKKK